MKKICIVTPFNSVGGAEKIAVNLANYYSKNGVCVTLITFKGIGPYINQVSENVKIIDLKVSRIRYVSIKLVKVIKEIQPDSILSVVRDANISLGLASALYKEKHQRIIFREANTMNEVLNMNLIKKIWYKALMRLSYSRADLVIANSKDTAHDLLRNNITTETKIIVIDNPVLPADFNKLASREIEHKWLNNDKYKTILTVGRLHHQKNQLLLINAFAQVRKVIPNAYLVIIGKGEEKEKLITKSKELGMIDFIDFIDFQQNPYPFYKNADVFVLSSLWEGFGNVIVEALSCGTKIISTDCPGGPRKILDNGRYGKLIPNHNSEAMAEAIIQALTEEDQEKKLRIERAKEFSIERIASQYLYYL